MPFEVFEIINQKDFGLRLDVFLSDKTGKTRSQIKNIIENAEYI